MKIATRSLTEQAVVTKRFEVRLNHDAVNAYKNGLQPQKRQQQQQQQRSHHRRETRTKETTITISGANNRRTIHTMNISSKASAQVRNSNGMILHRNAACQVNTIETSNRMICNGNGSSAASSSASSSVKSQFHRNMNDCFNALMTLNEQHAFAKINLKTEYNAKLKQLKRDYEQRTEEIKKKGFSYAGF